MSSQLPAVRKGTAGWVLRLEHTETGQVFTADLGTPAPDVLPKVEDAYRLLPALRAIATRARDLVTRLTDICVDDLAARAASERRVGDRLYRMELDSEWVVDGPGMRTALMALVKSGDLTQQEVDEATPTTVQTIVKANNTVLNALAKRRGGAVADIIGLNRRKQYAAPRIVQVE